MESPERLTRLSSDVRRLKRTTLAPTPAGAALISGDDAASQRATLGLGALATSSVALVEQGGTGQTTTQAAIDALTSAGVATIGHVLTVGGSNQAIFAAAGGADQWTYVVTDSDFTHNATSNANVPGLLFTPQADTTYLVEGLFLLRTSVTTTGARPGLSYPTGLTDAGSILTAPNSNTAAATRNQGATTTQNAASTGLPTTTHSYLGQLSAIIVAGESVSGDVQVTLASETAAVTVTMRAGSFLRYRTF